MSVFTVTLNDGDSKNITGYQIPQNAAQSRFYVQMGVDFKK